uniref:C2H2-type domain-containing protein n=1 Tax=Oryza punctata TaxID=4537 RepID=A0A0E0MF52_ORYPU
MEGDLHDEIEKGETDDEDEHHRRAVLRRSHDDDEGCTEYKRRRLENTATAPAPSAGSVLTTSNGGVIVAAIAAAAAAAPTGARELFACRICHKEFDTRKAVDGHMRVHRKHAIATPKDDDADNSRVTVVAEPRTDVDLSGGQGSSSAPRIPTVAPPAINPLNHNQAVDHQPAVAEPNASAADHHAPLVVEGAPQQSQAYRCKVQGCGRVFSTHQGLGGHAAGHLNRIKAAAAASEQGQGSSAAGAAVCHGGAGNGKHPCRECGQEWNTGVALGGHMRKHQNKEKVTMNKKELNVAGKCLSLGPSPSPELTPAGAEEAALPPVDQPLLSVVVGAEFAAPALLAFAADEAAALQPHVHQAEAEAVAEAAALALLPAAAEAAALPPVESGAEAADDGAAPAAPLPAPIAGMGTVRIFGFLVEKPAPDPAAEERVQRLNR